MTQLQLARKLQRCIRDRIRGFSDADIESARRKIEGAPYAPGALIRVTQREMKAISKIGEKDG